MRTASLVAAILLWPHAAVAQERVAVNLHVTVPDFLSLSVDRETVIAETDAAVTRLVEIRVQANRAWSLVVACEAQGPTAEIQQTDESPPTVAFGPVRVRNVDTDAPAECSGPVGMPAARGMRGDDGRVVLEVVAPRGMTSALSYTLIPR